MVLNYDFYNKCDNIINILATDFFSVYHYYNKPNIISLYDFMVISSNNCNINRQYTVAAQFKVMRPIKNFNSNQPYHPNHITL